MGDFLTAVKSVRTRKEDDGGDALLTAEGPRDLRQRSPDIVKTAPIDFSSNHTINSDTRLPNSPGAVREDSGDTAAKTGNASRVRPPRKAETPTEALQALRSRPSLDELSVVLEQLKSGQFNENFHMAAPGPLQAQIINTLLSEIVPTFWPALKAKSAAPLLYSLESVAGLNAVVARLRLLVSQKTSAERIRDLLDVASRLFTGDKLLLQIWHTMQSAVPEIRKRNLLWKETVNLIGSGKVIGAVAQAENALRDQSSTTQTQITWLSSSNEYCAWLGRNIAQTIHQDGSETNQTWIKDVSLLLPKGLHLGHSGQLLKGLLSSSTGNGGGLIRAEQLRAMMQFLPSHAKRTFIEHILRWLSSAIALDAESIRSKSSGGVPAMAGLLSALLKGDENMLRDYLLDPTLSSSLSLPVQRACLAVLADNSEDDDIQDLLEKLIASFSSTLFIAHAPGAQQESLARSILIAAGYVHRKEPMSLLMTARSSGHMQGVSNRLDSSNVRARWLGLVVGMALSKLVDKPGSQMEFGTEEIKTEEARQYADLVMVNDAVGTLQGFQLLLQAQQQLPPIGNNVKSKQQSSKKANVINGKPVFGPPRPPPPAQTKIIGERVTEVLDASGSEDDLKPHAKPDSDPEDSDEDATLVNRNKARAPVYIRDLMAGLRDDKNYDKFNLAIKTAAQLIRRKAGFGKEVKDHAEELASMLCNLQDPFDTDDFDDMRLQALVAVLLNDVKVIAPLLSRQAYAEGYSIAQRCVILSALGVGGRELAGFKIEDEDYNPKLSNTDFPSKKLPPKLHAIYSSSALSNQTKRLDAASTSIEHQMIQPMALKAADESTSHLNAVKVRTFSSRMEVEKARTKRKPAPNELAKTFGEFFFFPLANRYQQELAAYGSSSIYASAPFVLVTFIKTLALLLHASGPATLGLPQISAEMWDLLLSLRVQAIGDISVLQAVLFALLTLLEINTDKQRIVQEHPKQLMETQQWVDLVFERMGSPRLVDDEGKSEEAKVRTLAAGVLMKCREIIEAYQKQLVGYDFR